MLQNELFVFGQVGHVEWTSERNVFGDAIAGFRVVLVAVRIAFVVAHRTHVARVGTVQFANATVLLVHVFAVLFFACGLELAPLIALEKTIVTSRICKK